LVKDRISTILGLGVDTTGAIEAIRQDEDVARYAGTLRLIRPYQTDTVFESIIKAIIQQQISFRAANSITRRLVLATQEPVSCEGLQFHGFPKHDDILSFGRDRLKALGLGHKAEYISDICKEIERGEFSPERLREETYSSAASTLGVIRGIGSWTIGAVAISGLGHFDTFPYSDLGIRRIVGRLVHRGQRASIEQVRAFRNRFGKIGDLVLYLLMCGEVIGALS
jgi:3-methyladenine DNA glycosylase/8-oxoguanine DNA glycosylase